jgi:carbonic anhydrase/acetyltransferase-like protein (isoleucine patch superfamily)
MPSMLRRIRRSFFLPVIASGQRLKLKWMARMSGGQVLCGQKISFGHPVVFQGRGRLVIEDGVSLGYGLAGAINKAILLQPREPGSEIILGKQCAVMNGCELIARTAIRVGERTLIGPHTWIVDADFHGLAPEQRYAPGKTAPVIIEENVWIGAKVIILKGVRIGANAVVAAGCVVSSDVAAGAIVAGNPMQVIGSVDANR